MARKPNAVKDAEKSLKKWEYNYAKDRAVRDRCAAYLLPMINQAKINRRAKEEEWMEDLRLWRCKEPEGAMYIGRANIFIPELRHQVESSVGRFQQGLFPSADYVNCIPSDGTMTDVASNIQAAVKYELDYKNNLPAILERFQRQKVLYGTSPMRCSFVKNEAEIFVRDAKGRPVAKKVPKYSGVKWEVCDLFHWYLYPETAEPDQAWLQFEERFINKRDLEKDPEKYVNLEQVSVIDPQVNIWSWADTTRILISNISTAMSTLPNSVLVQECFLDFDIEEGEWTPCRVYVANGTTIIGIQRNPFWFQAAPYLVGRYLKSTMNEFYGASLPEALRGLQYVMNDTANQTMDSLAFSLNPIALIDPGFAGDVNSFKIQPGAKWFASPQGVQFANFPDVSQSGWTGMQQIRAMISQFGDDAVSIAPQLSGKVRTATQASAVQGEMNANLKNMVRCDEFEVMTPLCRMTHSLLQQYQEDSYQIMVQGPDRGSWIMKQIQPNDLVGDVHWIWKGSSEAEKSAVRNQQLLGFYNIAGNAAAQAPGQIDMMAFTKMVGKEAFGLQEEDMIDIFVDEKKNKTVDPEAENLALLNLDEVRVNDGDIFEVHMESHKEAFDSADSQEQKISIARHMQSHITKKKALDALQEQQAKIRAMQMTGQMEGEGGGPQGQGGPRQSGPGNQQQISSSPGAMLQGMRGVNPNV